MKAKNEVERDILRFLVAELGRGLTVNVPTDDQVVKMVKKIIENNMVTLQVCPPADPRFARLTAENTVLAGLLPKEWDATTVEAFLLDHNDPIFEQIQDAPKEGAAVGIAMKALKAVNAPVDGKVVGEVVKKIRTEDKK
jgi:hypothetical protein